MPWTYCWGNNTGVLGLTLKALRGLAPGKLQTTPSTLPICFGHPPALSCARTGHPSEVAKVPSRSSLFLFL